MTLETGIYNGDCRKLLPVIEPGSVQLVLTDPPYQISRANNFETMGRGSIDFPWEDEELALDQWLPMADRILKPSGSMIVWYDFWKLHEVRAILEELGYDVKRAVQWTKTNPWPRNKERSAIQAFEMGLWAVKPKKRGSKWVFNRRPEASYETLMFENDDIIICKTGVARMPRGRARHKALKPLGMFRDLVKIFSNPGDLVVDPFAGQGTTACAATLEGRLQISFEKDRNWFNEATDRWEETKDLA